jgi:glycosyltransferase involved in cell wall biosynthesis
MGTSVLLLDLNAKTPRIMREIEKVLRLNIYAALQAKLAEDKCDIVWAGSEKVGIPLSFLGIHKPLVVVTHHMNSPVKAKFARMTGIIKKWDGVGYISDACKNFFIRDYGVDPDRLFLYESAKYLENASTRQVTYNGPIMSAGVAKRDYKTLVQALMDLPECETELFISSKFGDTLRNKLHSTPPASVKIINWVPEDEMILRYQRSRFVVVPLQATTHNSAGINAILEAGAFSKPVIATKTGGMSSYVCDGETGILVPPHDVYAMREAIYKLWNNPALAKQMGQANRKFIEERYHPKEVDAKVEAFIQRLFHQHQDGRTL